jgi:hypothetical protein
LNTIGGRPVLAQIRCRYRNDAGSWFVYAPSGGPITWTWKSASGSDQLPAPRDPTAKVKNDVVVLPFWFGALLYLSLVGLAMFIVVYLNNRRH